MSDILQAATIISNNGRASLIISPATMLEESTPRKVRMTAEALGLEDAANLRELPSVPLVFRPDHMVLTLGDETFIDIPETIPGWVEAAKEFQQVAVFLATETVGHTDKFEELMTHPKRKKIFYGLAAVE